MMENRDYLNRLFDIYKDLLTPTEQETFINYYMEDLSLSEIADNRGISKSAVGKTLKQAEEKLVNYETILKNLEVKTKINEVLDESNIDVLKEKIKKVIDK
ncbi:MAG: hypothetical protein K2J20_00380 [Bacilli bacterium]|nr:hypothetical protein [Bacilli bacterium]